MPVLGVEGLSGWDNETQASYFYTGSITDAVQMGTTGGKDEDDEEVWQVEHGGGAGGIFTAAGRADFLSSLSFLKRNLAHHTLIKHSHPSVSQMSSVNCKTLPLLIDKMGKKKE